MHPFCGPTMNDFDFSDILREVHGAFSGNRGGCRSSSSARCGPDSGAGAFASTFASAFMNGQRIEFHASDEAYFAYVNARGTSYPKLQLERSKLLNYVTFLF
jgi:hypothetical protein